MKIPLLGLILALAVLALDQWSKYYMLTHLTGDQVTLTPFFNFALVWNSGISFGIFARARQPLVLTAISGVIMLILLIWLARNREGLTAFALASIIGGAAGNMIDRLRYGAVVDFLDAHIGAYHWPAFNVADSFIFIGVVLLCAGSMFSSEKPPARESTL